MRSLLARLLAGFAVAVIAHFGVPPANAQDFAVEPLTVSGPVGTSTDGNFIITGTWMPVAAAVMGSGAFSLTGEILTVLPADDIPEPPTLVINGSLEDGTQAFVPHVPGFMSLPAGSGVLPGWTTLSAEIAWASNANPYGPQTPYGDFFLDFTGFHDGKPYGGIRQTVATLPGQTYRLTFALGANQDEAGFRGPVSADVVVDHTTNTFTFTPEALAKGNLWITFERAFVATESLTLVRIEGVASKGGGLLGLDAISVRREGSDAELLVNGDFEDASSFVPDPNGLRSLPPDADTIPGWRTVASELVWASNANVFGPRTPFGSLFLDLTGYHDAPPYGGIAQAVTTIPGQTYRLRFALGVDQDIAAYRGPVAAQVTVGSSTSVHTLTPPGSGNQWGTFSLDFTAKSPATDLAIVGQAAAGGQYLGLDNISLVPLSPPQPLVLTWSGVGGAALHLTFPTQTGRCYVLESCVDLPQGAWTPVPETSVAGNGGPVEVAVPTSPVEAQRFYRLREMACGFGARTYGDAAETSLAAAGVAHLDIIVPARLADYETLAASGDRNDGLSETPPVVFALAAKDLQRVLSQVTGAPFRIVVRSETPERGIVLGTRSDFPGVRGPRLDEALWLGADGFDGREAFYIYTEGTRLSIIANSEFGLNHGVQHLLHRLGYRNLSQSPTWEIIPSVPTLKVAMHESSRPAYYTRGFGYASRDNDLASPRASSDYFKFRRTLRFVGSSMFTFGGHYYPSVIASAAGRALFEAHPEYLQGFGPSGAFKGVPDFDNVEDYQPDFSRAEVRELFLASYRNLVRQTPAGQIVSLSAEPSDGNAWYLQDLADPDWYRHLGYTAPAWRGTVSDHVYGFANFIADTLGREFPDRNIWVTLYAYASHDVPPNFDLHRKVSVSVAMGFCQTPGCNAADLLAQWGAKLSGSPLAMYDYVSVPTWHFDHLPSGLVTTSAGLKQRYFDAGFAKGVRGHTGEGSASMGMNALAYYLMALAHWDPLADFDAARADYLAKAFGSAAGEMEAYVQLTSTDNIKRDSPNVRGEAVRRLDAAGQVARAAGETMAEARINELKCWWYYQYLDDVLTQQPGDDAAFARFYELFFRQNPFYAVSWAAFFRRLEKHRQGSWPEYTTPMPWQGSMADSCGGPDAPKCSDPAWTRYGYAPAEVDAWWPLVLAHYDYIPLTETAYSNDLTPVQEFANVFDGSMGLRRVMHAAGGSAEAWLYSFEGEPVQAKVLELCASIRGGSPKVFYEWSLYDQHGTRVAGDATTPDHLHDISQSIPIEAVVPGHGPYRLEFLTDASCYALKQKPGYPLSFSRPDRGSILFPNWLYLSSTFYVPRGTRELDVDARFSSTVKALAPQAGLASFADWPFQVRSVDLPVMFNGLTGGAFRLPVALEETGALWQFSPGYHYALALMNVPNVFSTDGAYLMVPREVMIRDGLTEALAPLPPGQLRLAGLPGEFSGDYTETLLAPAIPIDLLPRGTPGWDEAWNDAKAERAVYQHALHPNIKLVRTIASPLDEDAHFVAPALGNGYYVLYDTLKPTVDWLFSEAVASMDEDDLPERQPRRTWKRVAGPMTPGMPLVDRLDSNITVVRPAR